MKFCAKCGKELHDDAVICMGCGCAVETPLQNTATDNQLVRTLSERVKTESIIWIIIGALQLLSGVFFIIGILNIISGINDLKYSKEILENPSGIVERYTPLTMPIITFAYNLIFGGIVGVIGSVYYFVAIRSFVMENKDQFEALN